MSKTTKALKKQATQAQLVAQRSTEPFVAEQMSTLADAFRAQAAVLKRKRKRRSDMAYTVTGSDIRGFSTVTRKTPELALKKAKEFVKRGCYDVRITTPEGRTYHSSEFGDLPRTPVARRFAPRHPPAP
jgi:hypothetical protein